jgi:hypothetical protein
MRTTVQLQTAQVSIKHIDSSHQAGIVHQLQQHFLLARTVLAGVRECSHPYHPIQELQVSTLGIELQVDGSLYLRVQIHSSHLMVHHSDRRH